MGQIHKLDIITANSIAAGEVVERPASVVKELCENAMDAGATAIQIDITQGGIRSIRISDNGCGMDREDALEAFEAHATSKLQSITDLEHISSMGFRGEALPSIASVSEVTLRTRQIGSDSGTIVRIRGGVLEEHAPVGTAEGTSIEVENLFFNVPARHKFLKRDATEAARISDVVNRLILARPDISFMLRRDGKVLIHSPGNADMASAVYAVFGREIQKSAIDVEQVDQANAVRVSGMIGRPNIARKSRASQFIFVNGRSVQSPMINKAIDEAYRGYLMKGEFAFAILKIEIPQSLLDVNVHPQKLEVRFWNEAQVFSAVMHAIRDSLYNNLEIKSEETVDSEALAKTTEQTSPEQTQLDLESIANKTDELPITEAPSPLEVATLGEEATAYAMDETEQAEPHTRESVETPVLDPIDTHALEPVETQASSPIETRAHVHPDLEELLGAKLVGVLFTTYIILEHGESYTIIDQHAAHEKVLFERLLMESKMGREAKSQILLAPEIVRVSHEEMDILNSETDFFMQLGFHYDRFGEQEIALRSVPYGSIGEHAAGSLRAALDEILDSKQNFGLEANRDAVYLAIATAACKAAIKANDRITGPEIEALLRDLVTLENPYQCPHGRPVFIRSSKKEIEKRFRRIV